MGSTQKRVLLAIIATIVLATFVVGCGRSGVVKVNGRKITRQEYNKRLERLPYRDPVSGQPMEAGAWVLQQLINEELILRLAEKERVVPTEEQIKERIADAQKQPGFAGNLKASGLTRDELRELMRVKQAAFNLQTKGVKVSDKEVKDYYEKSKEAQFTTLERVYVAAVFTKTEADAEKAMDLLDKNVEFGTVARTLSIEPNSAKQDGRLGVPITRGDQEIPESVQELLFGTPKGEYTKPIPYGEGTYVIFKILQHHPKTTEKFADVKHRINEALMLEKGGEKNVDLGQELVKFRETAKIEVSIQRYKDLLTPKKAEEKEAEGKEDKKGEAEKTEK